MKRQRSFRVFFATALIFTRQFGFAQTNTIVIPKEAENLMGDISGDPFFFSEGGDQQVYAASEFYAIATAIRITTVAFRVDERADRPLDALKPGMLLEMNVFAGSMKDLVRTGDGRQEPIQEVFRQAPVHFLGSSTVKAFDVRFNLETAFLYDPRQGQLVLTFLTGGGFSGHATSMDAQAIYSIPGDSTTGSSYDRGAFIKIEPLSGRRVTPGILVTEFSYEEVSATIESIRKAAGVVELYFLLKGNPKVQVEGSSKIEGSFTPETEVELMPISDTAFRAVLPGTTDIHFYRLRLQ